MTSGQIIKQEREKHRMSQEELAEKMGVSRQAVSKWEADQSRPTKEKLEKLATLFELSEDVWVEEPPPPPERAALRRWRGAALALAAALCATLILGMVFWPRGEMSPEEELKSQTSSLAPYPEQLSFQRRWDMDQSDWVPERWDASLVTARDREEHTLFLRGFPNPTGERVFLSAVATDPYWENGTTFYDVYLLYASPGTDMEWRIMTCLATDNHYVTSGDEPTVTEFTNVQGCDGLKISLTVGAGGTVNWYVAQDREGEPYILLESGGTGYGAVECDVDADGEKEVVSPFGLPMGWIVYDKIPGGWAAYELNAEAYGVLHINFTEEDGFVVQDAQGQVLVRYLFAQGAELRLQPDSDFSLPDYPDVAGTELEFRLDARLSDGLQPDEVLNNGTVCVTHRQQAYLALQLLFDLTGIRLDSCVCSADGGSVYFYAGDPADDLTFFNVSWDRGYGGDGPFSINIFWQEDGGCEFSPLSRKEALQPESYLHQPERLLLWCYDRLSRFIGDEVVNVVPDPTDTYGDNHTYLLYLPDGSAYWARLHPDARVFSDFGGPLVPQG